MAIYAGFDLGGSRLKYGLIDSQGKILFSSSAPTPPQIEELISLLKKCWLNLKRQSKKKIAACGVGFPGIFSLKEQKIINSPNYPHLNGFDLHPFLSQFIDVPYWLHNDANLAAFGEFKLGAGQGAQSMVLLTIGTGIGTGLIFEGKLWQGKCGFAGELGHVPVNPRGDKCHCGSYGCLETEVSAPKIVKNYKALKNIGYEITAEEVFKRAKRGDQAALKVYADAGRFLGVGLAIVINFLNPEKIILGGGVMRSGELLLPPALSEARQRSYEAAFACCQIEQASLGNRAGLVGAALWAKEQNQQR